MHQTRINRLVTILSTPGSCSYQEDTKAEFHKLGLSYLRHVAKLLGLEKSTYKVRSNKGGIAVSGEITLHHDSFYFQLSADDLTGMGQLYRTCAGQKDYTGGVNRYMQVTQLVDPADAAAALQPLVEAAVA